MTAHTRITSREHQLEEALRGLCEHITRMQLRAAYYLPNGDRDEFVDDILNLLDGPDQRRVQAAARRLLNEPHAHIHLAGPRPGTYRGA